MPKPNKKKPTQQIVTESHITKKQTSKEEQLSTILQLMNEMNLDNQNMVDWKAFDQAATILEAEVQHYERCASLFEKGEWAKLLGEGKGVAENGA